MHTTLNMTPFQRFYTSMVTTIILTKTPSLQLLKKIQDIKKTKAEKQRILLKPENFWIQKLKTLHPFGLNQTLNKE